MWNFQLKRNLLRDRMISTAPEADPHEFVRRYLLSKPQPLPGSSPGANRQLADRQLVERRDGVRDRDAETIIRPESPRPPVSRVSV